MDSEHYQYLGKRLTLSLGLLAFGLAAGFAISLAWMQSAAIAQGALPQPGTPVAADIWTNTPLWETAKTMQTAANGAGIVGAMLVLGYAALDRYGGELT